MTIANCACGVRSGLIGFPTDLITPPGVQMVGPGGAFLPSSLSGLKLWLDFSDLTTLFIDSAGTIPVVNNGDLIGRAKDKSGNGNDAIQATTANKFTWTLPGWSALGVGTADGANDFMQTAAFASALNQPVTIIIVARHNGDFTANRHYCDGIATGKRYILFHNSISGVLTLYAGVSLASTNATTGVPVILSAIYNGASSALFLNGSSVKTGNAGTDTLSGLTLASRENGTANFFNGNYGEVLIYLNLSAADQALVEGYLNTKWTVF